VVHTQVMIAVGLESTAVLIIRSVITGRVGVSAIVKVGDFGLMALVKLLVDPGKNVTMVDVNIRTEGVINAIGRKRSVIEEAANGETAIVFPILNAITMNHATDNTEQIMVGALILTNVRKA